MSCGGCRWDSDGERNRAADSASVMPRIVSKRARVVA
jgi:hypothetical protein